MLKLVIVAAIVGMAAGHGRFMEPPGRSSLWRFPEFAQYNPETYPIDDQVWCDNVHQFENVDNCGVCGDPASQARPREHENGGRFGRGIIVRTYTAGEKIPVHVTSNTQNHGGYVKIQICDQLPETEECFKDLLLGNGEYIWKLTTGDGTLNIETTVQLPADLRCEQCTLRFHYRGSQNWGTCDDSTTCQCQENSGDPPGGLGCSAQQTFRNCADIAIV